MTLGYASSVSATLTGVLHRLLPQRAVGRLTSADRLDGRTCLVTGANRGLGLAVASELCRRGGRVLMACRTLDRDALAQVNRAGANARAELLQLDLGRLTSVEQLADQLRDRGVRLDVVVLNAGVVPRQARRTVDGFEEGFQVNFLANVALLRRLLADGTLPCETFAASRDGTREASPPRIVMVSSETHRSCRSLNWDNLGRFYPYGISAAMSEYGKNKLLLTTYAVELSRRLQRAGSVDVVVHTLCPGAVNTGIAGEAPAWSRPLLGLIFKLFFASPAEAALPVAYLACSRSLPAATGIYLHRMTRKAVAPMAEKAENGALLWEISERLLREGPP